MSAGDYVDTMYWTAIEIYVAIIIPSLPAIRCLLCHKYPHLFVLDRNSRLEYERGDRQDATKRNTSPEIIRDRDLEGLENEDYFERGRITQIDRSEDVPPASGPQRTGGERIGKNSNLIDPQTDHSP
jgi:hypothetical protein